MENIDKRTEYLNILRRFKEEYGKEYGITSLGIFGSVARGDFDEDSDVDVLLEANEICYFSRMDIKYRLEEMMGTKVDVIRNDEYLRPRFKDRVDKEVIYV
jgi:predicted nucleotidyltransferase